MVSLEEMRLILIRHAQPAWIERGRMVGNPVLTELGGRQARQLAGRSWPDIDELWVSELRRARETAASPGRCARFDAGRAPVDE